MLGFLRRLASRWSAHKEPIVAMVLFQSAPQLLTRGHVANALTDALGRPFAEVDVTEEGTSFLRVFVDGFNLTVASMPVPYGSTPGKAANPARLANGVREPRLRDAIERHVAFLTIDCWAAPEGRKREDAIPLMGKILAALFDDTSLAVTSLVTNKGNLVDEALTERFRNGEAAEAMAEITYDGISEISGEDPRLTAAVAEARTRWPEFVAAFQRATDREAFIVKGPFTDGTHTEFMWIQVTEIDPDAVHGILMNKPFKVRGIRAGSAVSVPVPEINDWLYAENDEPHGAFTEALVRSAI